MKRLFQLAFFLFIFAISYADDPYDPVEIYDYISDISHPTFDDYRIIQNYLTHGE